MNNKAIILWILLGATSFIALKFSIWPAVFVYPFCLYQILKKTSLKTAPLWLFCLGILYFFSLFLWGTTTGIELNLYGGFVSGIIFGLSGLLFKLTEKKLYPLLKKVDLVLWPFYFYICQQAIFPLIFVDASYLLDVPPFLPYLSYYIGSGGMHFILMFVSIWAGWSFMHKKISSLVISLTFAIGLFGAQTYHLYSHVELPQNSVKIALIQGNRTEDITWKRNNAVKVYEFYKEKIISAATQGAQLIILPENTILFWSSSLDPEKAKSELTTLAKQHQTHIVFSTLETTSKGQIESRGYVFSPEGMQPPYPAQKVYDYIRQDDQFTVGNEIILYPTSFGTLRLLICFEALFRDQLDQEKHLDYDHIIVMANNQFLPSHQGLKTLEWNVQDLAGTYRKNVLYASNNGPTSVTNKYGRTTHRLEYDTEAILWAELEIN